MLIYLFKLAVANALCFSSYYIKELHTLQRRININNVNYTLHLFIDEKALFVFALSTEFISRIYRTNDR